MWEGCLEGFWGGFSHTGGREGKKYRGGEWAPRFQPREGKWRSRGILIALCVPSGLQWLERERSEGIPGEGRPGSSSGDQGVLLPSAGMFWLTDSRWRSQAGDGWSGHNRVFRPNLSALGGLLRCFPWWTRLCNLWGILKVYFAIENGMFRIFVSYRLEYGKKIKQN